MKRLSGTVSKTKNPFATLSVLLPLIAKLDKVIVSTFLLLPPKKIKAAFNTVGLDGRPLKLAAGTVKLNTPLFFVELPPAR